MSPPIRDGSGNSIGSIRLGDGTEISEVRTGAGDVVFSAIPDSGVSRWEFEQDVTNSWNGYDGSNNGGNFITDSAVGNYAIYLDRNDNDQVVVSTISEINNTSEFSFSCWVKPNVLGPGENPAFMAQSDSFDNLIAIYDSSDTNNYKLAIRNDGNIAEATVPHSDISTSSYQMLTLTYNSGTVTAYYNDVQKDTGTGSATTPTISDNFRMGFHTAGSNYINATIDDARVYSKELTPTEVSNLYNTGSING